MKGFFSLPRFLYTVYPLLSTFFIAVIILLLLYFMYVSFSRKVPDNILFAYTLVTLLVIDPWLSEHHLPLMLLAYVLLIGQQWWQKVVLIAYVLTDLHYDFFQNITFLEYSWFTYFRYAGVLLLFIYVLVLLLRDISKRTTPTSRDI